MQLLLFCRLLLQWGMPLFLRDRQERLLLHDRRHQLLLIQLQLQRAHQEKRFQKTKAESLEGNNKDATGNIFGEARTQTTRKETGLLAHMLLAHRLYCFPKISFQNKPPIS